MHVGKRRVIDIDTGGTRRHGVGGQIRHLRDKLADLRDDLVDLLHFQLHRLIDRLRFIGRQAVVLHQLVDVRDGVDVHDRRDDRALREQPRDRDRRRRNRELRGDAIHRPERPLTTPVHRRCELRAPDGCRDLRDRKSVV